MTEVRPQSYSRPGVLRYQPVRPRRTRRCVTCERLIPAGAQSFYIVAYVDGLGFRYGYECARCER